MVKSFSVIPYTKEEAILFFKEADLSQFKSHVVPLFGPNGVGKSTLIKGIEDHSIYIDRDDRNLEIFSYQNSRDNFKSRKSRNLFEEYDPRYMNARFDAQLVSEGQSVIYSMLDLLDGFMKNGQLKYENNHDYLVLLDEIDSGISIDVIDFIMRKIKYIIRTRTDVQFIFSFNSPRVLKHFPQVLSMYDGKMIELHTEDDMLKVMNDHKKAFNKVRKKSNGRPKIYD